MKAVLYVLLAASLAGNVVLGLRSLKATTPATTGPSSIPSSSSSTSIVAPGHNGTNGTASAAASASGASLVNREASAALGPIAWQPNGSEQDLRRLVTSLRAAGYPPAIVRAVVQQLLGERFAARQPNAGQPFWKQLAPTAETVAALHALNKERQALYENLLGADARPSATLDASARFRRYGNLSDDKIDSIARIERDYSEITAETFAMRRSNAAIGAETIMQSQQLMEREKLADLAAVLTPEELAQYEMRNSQTARTLMSNLRNVDVTEPEYALLYEAQKAFDTANPRRASMDGNTYAQRQTAQAALHEQVRALLGDSRFYAYLEGADPNYAGIVRALNTFPTVTPTVSYQVYQLQTELQQVMAQVTRDGPPSAQKTAEMRATMEAFNGRLESLIGSEAAEAYRKQGMGRMFGSFRTAPSTLQPIGR